MINEQTIDLLLVQESAHPDEHLPPLLHADARTRWVWTPVKQNGWGSGIYSATGTVTAIPVSGFEGWVIGAEITGSTWQNESSQSMIVFSIHAPSVAESYSKQVMRILDVIYEIAAGRDMIIGGDFNLTVSASLETSRPISKQDLEIRKQLSDKFGLINCWQEANPNQPLAQTLRWSREPNTPYHCDGLFVPSSWRSRLESSIALSGDEWIQLSDHNPVVATFR